MARKDDIIDTGIPGIKQKKSNGKYVVTLDLGRRRVTDEKTGQVKTRQVKTTRTVDTLKEAKAILGKNAVAKTKKKNTGTTRRITFKDSFQEYMDFWFSEWDATNQERNSSYQRRLNAYFGDMDIKKIDTLEIELFFRWCRTSHKGFRALQNKTIASIKSLLSSYYKYMKKSPDKYGITDNPVIDAYVGDIEEFEALTLTVEEVNSTFRYMLDNEHDTSIWVCWCLACFVGMRRGEIAALRWGDLDLEQKRIHVTKQRKKVSRTFDERGWIETVPKTGKNNGRTERERKERWTAFPDVLAFVLRAAKKQQEVYSRREVTDEDYVYRPKSDLVNGILGHPDKLSERNKELQNRYNKARIKAGKEPIPHYRLHDLRHSHVSLCLNGGVLPFQVYFSVGHAFNKHTDPTTLRVYLHDDGDRSQINDYIDKMITTPLEIFDMEEDLLTPKQRLSKRRNIRSDEV